MKDGAVRKILKLCARQVFNIDLAATRFLRKRQGERPYKLGGNCALCAKCCESPMVQTSRLVFHSPLLRRAFLLWMQRVNGFVYVREDRVNRVFVFQCTHFNPQTRACDSYSSRPGMCRDYPRLLLWEANPPFLPGCGYKAIDPNAERLKALLEAELKNQNLPPEKREEIEEKLKLR
ncbi:MAG: YkgJ family cysteine cluster protein [Sumerlaeia bacterium]